MIALQVNSVYLYPTYISLIRSWIKIARLYGWGIATYVPVKQDTNKQLMKTSVSKQLATSTRIPAIVASRRLV